MESISNPENIKEGDTVYFKGDEKRTLPLTVTKVEADQITCVCQVTVQSLTKDIHSLQVSNPDNIQVWDIVCLKTDRKSLPMQVIKIENGKATCVCEDEQEKVYPIERLTKIDPSDNDVAYGLVDNG